MTHDDEIDDDDQKAGDQANKFMKKALDERFKEIDSLLNKKVLKNLIDLGSVTTARLDGMEKGNYILQDRLRKDMLSRFAKLKQELQEKNIEMEQKLKREFTE